MAKVPDKVEGGEPAAGAAASPPSAMGLIVAMVVLTGLSLGAGGLFGLLVLSKPPAPAAKAASVSGEVRKTRFSEKVTVHALPPIVTNLASPERAWIRIEASLVTEEDSSAEGKANAVKVAEDAVAYLRTLSLPMIEGASGLLHLREDLLERARLRTGGKVQDLIVHTLILE